MSSARVVLSESAKTVLVSANTNRQGARVRCPDPAVWEELKDAGLIGPGGGLTARGSTVRARTMDRLMDQLFPL